MISPGVGGWVSKKLRCETSGNRGGLTSDLRAAGTFPPLDCFYVCVPPTDWRLSFSGFMWYSCPYLFSYSYPVVWYSSPYLFSYSYPVIRSPPMFLCVLVRGSPCLCTVWSYAFFLSVSFGCSRHSGRTLYLVRLRDSSLIFCRFLPSRLFLREAFFRVFPGLCWFLCVFPACRN